MRNVVTGNNFKLRWAKPPSFFPASTQGQPAEATATAASTGSVPGLSTAGSLVQKRSFSSSSFIKWRKESNKLRIWRLGSQTAKTRSVSSSTSSESSVLPTLFSYLSWISQVFQFGSQTTEDMQEEFSAQESADKVVPYQGETERLQRRLTDLGLKEIKVKGDGACQFRAIAAAMWNGDESRHLELRSSIIDWLRENEQTEIDRSGTLVSSFLDTGNHKSWLDYLNYQRLPNSWGDHLTLYGASNVYNIEIRVVSSVDASRDENAITTILPRGDRQPEKRITLSLWHEAHYNYCIPVPASEMAPSASSSSLHASGRIQSRL